MKTVNGKKLYECTFCKANYAKNATRMKKHIINCFKCPPYVKETISKFNDQQNRSDSTTTSTQWNKSLDNCSTSENEYNFQSENVALLSNSKMNSTDLSHRISSYFDSMNQAENQELDKLLARAIFSSGSPLALVHNLDWVNFMRKIRPSYKLPSRF